MREQMHERGEKFGVIDWVEEMQHRGSGGGWLATFHGGPSVSLSKCLEGRKMQAVSGRAFASSDLTQSARQ